MSQHLPTELRPFPHVGVVRLNVGGELFITTVQTLASQCQYFSALASTGAMPTLFLPDVQGGAFFIDRSARLFHRVLDFLRSGIAPSGLPVSERRELREEAIFYGCTALAEADELLQAPPPPPPPRTVYRVAANFDQCEFKSIDDVFLNRLAADGWKVLQCFENLAAFCDAEEGGCGGYHHCGCVGIVTFQKQNAGRLAIADDWNCPECYRPCSHVLVSMVLLSREQ